MAIGKTASNGTLNADGAFYSVQDVNVLLENAGGGDLPTPTVADAGKAVVVDEEGKYSLGEAGGGGLPTPTVSDVGKSVVVDDEGKFSLMNNLFYVGIEMGDDSMYLTKNYKEIMEALVNGCFVIMRYVGETSANFQYVQSVSYNNLVTPTYIVNAYSFYSTGVEESVFQSDSETGRLTLVEAGD